MSNVSNCLLSFSVTENEPERIAEVNSYFPNGTGFVSVDSPTLPRKWYGGSKMLEACLYIAAFNNLDEADFLKHLARAVAWRHPEYVQFIVNRQESALFEIVALPNRV